MHQENNNIKALRNRRTLNQKRKDEKQYKVNVLLQKLKEKRLGSYKIVKVHRYGRYDVEKVADGEGPLKTSTVAEFMNDFGRTEG
ncbi:GM11108 [Drosophila sechellia]|uniref:GM11108 n=1 Tax=Drosophila sechellia TaxID=7238 RepID=B4INT8_DROSE|nr:GM11108 [Drosophila sechellia]